MDHLWSFTGGTPVQNAWVEMGTIPAETDISKAMSADLRRRGFRFVGPTICYALMQSAGLVNDHLVGCFRYAEVAGGRAAGRRQRDARQASRSLIRPPVWRTAPE